MALAGHAVSEDGKYLAYGMADGRIRLADLADYGNRVRPSSGRRTEMGQVQRARLGPRTSQGCLYGRYDEPQEGEFQSLNLNQKVYYHRVGTPQSDDVLVYERPRSTRMGISGQR